MTDNHLIIPSSEMMDEWCMDFYERGSWRDIAIKAAQWGADQQLAEDAKWLDHNALNEPHLRITPVGESLIKAMRPKPPSLKEQALAELEKVDMLWDTSEFGADTLSALDTIRRALEALND